MRQRLRIIGGISQHSESDHLIFLAKQRKPVSEMKQMQFIGRLEKTKHPQMKEMQCRYGGRIMVFRLFVFCVLLRMSFAQLDPSLSGSQKNLDSTLQKNAFTALDRPRTGTIYPVQVPSNLTGVKANVVRLRSGSLYNRGIFFNEIDIPHGLRVEPYVQRLALVYQNLGNWSSVFYSRKGYKLVSSVVGLLAYDAHDLTVTMPPELYVVATQRPISISFPDVTVTLNPQCVAFYLNGSVEFTNASSGNKCLSRFQGHFGMFVESHELPPAPAPSIEGFPSPGHVPPGIHVKKRSSNTWKIVTGAVVGAAVIFLLLFFLAVGASRHRKRSRLAKMEQQADQGEALQTTFVGTSRAPAAGGTRTQPVIENEYSV